MAVTTDKCRITVTKTRPYKVGDARLLYSRQSEHTACSAWWHAALDEATSRVTADTADVEAAFDDCDTRQHRPVHGLSMYHAVKHVSALPRIIELHKPRIQGLHTRYYN